MNDVFSSLDNVPAKEGGQRGSYLLGNQSGTILIHHLRLIGNDLKKTVALQGTIVEAHPTVQGAITQRPGELVSRLYLLSKYPDIAPGELKADLLIIDGSNPDEMRDPKYANALMRKAIQVPGEGYGQWVGNNSFAGMYVNFTTKVKKRPGKVDFTQVFFSTNTIDNKPEQIQARRKELGF